MNDSFPLPRRRPIPPDAAALIAAGLDGPTGLPRRDAFLTILHRRADPSPAPGSRFVLLVMEFVSQQGRGEPVGKRLLGAAARRLRACIRASDLAGRLGPDEFGILLPDPTDARDGIGMGARLVTLMAQPFLLDEHAIAAFCRIGIATYPDDALDAAGLLACAGLALDQARRSGSGGLSRSVPAPGGRAGFVLTRLAAHPGIEAGPRGGAMG